MKWYVYILILSNMLKTNAEELHEEHENCPANIVSECSYYLSKDYTNNIISEYSYLSEDCPGNIISEYSYLSEDSPMLYISPTTTWRDYNTYDYKYSNLCVIFIWGIYIIPFTFTKLKFLFCTFLIIFIENIENKVVRIIYRFLKFIISLFLFISEFFVRVIITLYLSIEVYARIINKNNLDPSVNIHIYEKMFIIYGCFKGVNENKGNKKIDKKYKDGISSTIIFKNINDIQSIINLFEENKQEDQDKIKKIIEDANRFYNEKFLRSLVVNYSNNIRDLAKDNKHISICNLYTDKYEQLYEYVGDDDINRAKALYDMWKVLFEYVKEQNQKISKEERNQIKKKYSNNIVGLILNPNIQSLTTDILFRNKLLKGDIISNSIFFATFFIILVLAKMPNIIFRIKDFGLSSLLDHKLWISHIFLILCDIDIPVKFFTRYFRLRKIFPKFISKKKLASTNIHLSNINFFNLYSLVYDCFLEIKSRRLEARQRRQRQEILRQRQEGQEQEVPRQDIQEEQEREEIQ